jgi:hypothetical protein
VSRDAREHVAEPGKRLHAGPARGSGDLVHSGGRAYADVPAVDAQLNRSVHQDELTRSELPVFSDSVDLLSIVYSKARRLLSRCRCLARGDEMTLKRIFIRAAVFATLTVGTQSLLPAPMCSWCRTPAEFSGYLYQLQHPSSTFLEVMWRVFISALTR